MKKDKKLSQQEDLIAINKVLKGDHNAYSDIQNKYIGLVSGIIRKMINNEDDVKDLAQESFLKAYKALSSYKPQYSFSSWLLKIASNNCIDFLRKKRFNFVSIERPGLDDSDDKEYEIKDSSQPADMNLLADERKKIISEAIAQLPDNYQEIIRLRHEEELDYANISQKLDLPLGTVKAHLFRARKMLYEILKDKKEILMM